MNQKRITILLLFIGGWLFNYLFFGESIGINLAIFSVFAWITAWGQFRPQSLSRQQLIALLGNIAATVEVAWLNTTWAIIGWFVSFILLTGLLHQPAIRSVLYVIPSGLIAYVSAPVKFIQSLLSFKPKSVSGKLVQRTFKIGIAPLLILVVFYFIYQSGNAAFSELSGKFFSSIGDYISHFFDYFSFAQLLMFVVGLLVTAGLLINTSKGKFAKKDKEAKDELGRRDGNMPRKVIRNREFDIELYNKFKVVKTRMVALKTEYITGVVTLVSLNILLLIVNVIDVIYVWINFRFTAATNLSAETHDGINALIISIVLAMVVLIYFFRGRINFYSKNKTLRLLALSWLAQNFFLACSAFLRDYHYISFQGLTYKRIGIIVYLILVLVGLATMYIKVRKLKTLYYLLRVNAWAAFIALILMSSFDWDITIAEYNLGHQSANSLDGGYLLSLSNHALPELLENENKLKICYLYSDDYLHLVLQNEKADFIKSQHKVSWLSWNYADYCIKKALENNK